MQCDTPIWHCWLHTEYVTVLSEIVCSKFDDVHVNKASIWCYTFVMATVVVSFYQCSVLGLWCLPCQAWLLLSIILAEWKFEPVIYYAPLRLLPFNITPNYTQGVILMVIATDTVGKQDAGQILALVVCYLGDICIYIFWYSIGSTLHALISIPILRP